MDEMDFSEYKLVSDEKENGQFLYRDSHGITKYAYDDLLEDYLHAQLFSRLSNLAGVVNDDLYQRFMFIFELIVDDASRKLTKVFDLIQEKIGTITVHAFTMDYPYTGNDVPVNVFLEPKKDESQAELKKDFPSLGTLVKALSEGLHNTAIGALKELTAEIEKKNGQTKAGEV